jgi:hypothetical protein
MDAMLTMVEDTCYRLFARDISKFEDATSQTVFSKFIDTPGTISINGNEIVVMLRKNAHAPILISNPVFKRNYEIPWLDNINLRYIWK